MVTKTSGEIEKELIAGLKDSTGKDLSNWLTEIKAFSHQKRNHIINLLKAEYSFGHLNASLLAGIYANGGKLVDADTGELLANQFAKAEAMRPIYDSFIKFVQAAFPNSSVLPKKTYISILEKREFAAINLKAKELRLGFDLGDRAFDEVVTKSKLTGPMPRISHQIVLTQDSQLTGELVKLLEDSYLRSH